MAQDDRKSADKPAKDSGGKDFKPGPYGEGNYEASRKYNEGLKDHVQHHDIEKEARDAAPKDAAEEKEMQDAEREAASRAKEEDPALRKSKPSR
jgi:hypothetical protein